MKKAAKWMMFFGLFLLLLGAATGAFFTAVSMTHARQTLGANGISDPNATTTWVGNALVSASVGVVVAAFGLLTIVTGFVVLVLSKSGSGPMPLPPE